MTLLLKYGATMGSMNKLYQTELHIACISQNYDFVRLLVESGAELGPVDKNLKMPINYVEKLENKTQVSCKAPSAD